MKPPRRKDWASLSAKEPPMASQGPEARKELGHATASVPTPHTSKMVTGGRRPQRQQLWAWSLIIHPLSQAHTYGRHLFPHLCLQGPQAHCSITGSSGSLHCLGRGKLLFMTLLGERAASFLGPPLLTPWSHQPLRRSRRPKEPARPPSEQAKLSWCLRNLWKRAWGQGRPQLGPSPHHLQAVSLLEMTVSCLLCIAPITCLTTGAWEA